MTSNNNNWIADTVYDFIHSTIWAAPIHTFVEENCAAFDYDDDDEDDDEDTSPSTGAPEEEQKNIHQKYQRLANALINGLGNDLSLDVNELRKVCDLPTDPNDSGFADEAFEQLYAVKDFGLFQEMMRRKNLILQLQALVSLQLEWGLLSHGETGEDLVLSLLLQATAATPSSRRGSVAPAQQSMEQAVAKLQIDENEHKHQKNDDDDDDEDDDDDVVVVPVKETRQRPPPASSQKPKERREPPKPLKEEYQLPNLRRKGAADLDADWFRKLGQDHTQRESDNETIEEDQSKKAATAQAIRSIPEGVLRQKLRDLAGPPAAVDENAAAAVKSRKNFLQEQRDLIVQKQRAERERELERKTQEQQQEQQQTARPVRPQSAAHIARKAMGTVNEKEQPPTQIPDAEIQKRRAMADRLRREVVDKR